MNNEQYENTAPDVPYIVYEGEVARSERNIKRLWIALIVAIVMLFASNAGWLIYESQFETIYWEQDGEGINNMNTGEQGDVTYEPTREVKTEKEQQTKRD